MFIGFDSDVIYAVTRSNNQIKRTPSISGHPLS